MQKPYIKDENNGWLTVAGAGDISVFRTFDCGQCFRFDSVEDTKHKNRVDGIALGKYVSFADSDAEGELEIYSSADDFESLWSSFLSLDTDYEAVNTDICRALCGADRAHMERVVAAGRGIRILRQEPWEALCSFIVSQNNNIPRIKKIINAMCRTFGEKIEGGYSFPSPAALADAGEAAIFELKTGFRAKYIYDAAVKVCTGEVSLEEVKNAEKYDDAAAVLERISGVGPKVAACTLLFGFERLDAFPVDVWIKRVIEKRFPNGLDPAVFGPWAGIAQQYLFYFERYIGD